MAVSKLYLICGSLSQYNPTDASNKLQASTPGRGLTKADMFFSANTLNFASRNTLRNIERLCSSDAPQMMIKSCSKPCQRATHPLSKTRASTLSPLTAPLPNIIGWMPRFRSAHTRPSRAPPRTVWYLHKPRRQEKYYGAYGTRVGRVPLPKQQ